MKGMTRTGRGATMKSEDAAWRERGLLGAVLAGDEAAWRTWYEESFDGLYAYVLWRCAGLRDLADEVVQETWLTAVRRIQSFDPDRGRFAGWLRGIAANVLRNQGRRRAMGPRGLDPTLPAPPDGAIDNLERSERIAAALTTLPERYEAVLRAKYLDGQSMVEIAAAWDQTPKGIESLLTRARQAFREAYLQTE
jgi:RNA polymerase sigma-70 factor (ECF subfamily)